MNPEPDSPNPTGTGQVLNFPPPADAIDLTAGAPEKFPLAAFPPLLRAVAENMAAVYQTPFCLPAMSALGVLSGAVGKSAVVRGAYKDKATRLNLYVIGVAERGSGKGNIGETLCAPLSLRSAELAEEHRKSIADKRSELGVLKREIARMEGEAAKASGAERANLLDGLSNRQARLEELEREAARERNLLVGDTTSEALARVLADNEEQLFTYSAEAGAAVKVALGKYSEKGESDCDLLLSGYSGDAVRTSRVTRKGVHLLNPCLALFWLVQDCIARKLFGDDEAVSRGLTARLLIFDTGARREHDDRRSLAFDQETAWSQFLREVLDRRLSGKEPLEIACSAEAREEFARFHDESVDLERGPFADLAGELSRWRENAIKIAGLFALAEGATVISAEIAARANSVVRWCGFNYLGLEYLARRGLLWFGMAWDDGREWPAWIVTDASRRNAQARKMDGGLWHGIGGKKAKSLPGVLASWPIGAVEIGDRPFVLLCEGQPDFCAALLVAWWEWDGLGLDLVAPVCMTGAGNPIHADALPYFAGKHVRIAIHDDADGHDAARRWADQLYRAGARKVDGFDFAGMTLRGGGPVEDLADLATLLDDEVPIAARVLPANDLVSPGGLA